MRKLVLVVSVLSIVFMASMITADIKNQPTYNEKEWALKLDEMNAEIKAKGYTYTVGYNSACQYALKDLCGFNPDLGSLDSFAHEPLTREAPKELWGFPLTYAGFYSSVKNQSTCGSCWAFAMAGAVEGLFLKTMGTEVNLSEQWLLDCNPFGYDCTGGFLNFNMFITGGAPIESCYPYVSHQQTCNTTCPGLYFIYDWDWVTNSTSIPPVNSIKQAITDYGSVAVGVYANATFQAYTGGVYNNCVNSTCNHAVILCGWDDNLGAWLLKNSWGLNWGGVDINGNGIVDPNERGFMWITFGCNKVGYAAAYPIPYYGG
jgi:C1A family cysteine protease